jgi:predicted dehydrogenase
MGMNHLRVYDALPAADLVEVVEPDPDRAAAIADAYDVTVHDTVDALETAEAVTVAVPNAAHRRVAVACLERGMDVLVEKPLALTLEDATAIADMASREQAVLQVGHIERFNPAVSTLNSILETEEVIAVEAHRLGPFNQHLTQESVVFDLMIHDLDIARWLVGEPVESLSGLGSSSRSEEIDHAIANFEFENGVLGTSVASHVTHGKIRRLDVTTRDAYVVLNYQEQSITIQRRGTERTTTLNTQSGYRTETVTETPYIRTREPLKNELEHFLECVETGRRPRVDGEQGIQAVRLAIEVIESMNW